MLSPSLLTVLFFCIFLNCGDVQGGIHHRYAPVVQRRQAPVAYTYTWITPSPGASPVAVTTQGQVVTTYVPRFTTCPTAVAPILTALPQTLSASVTPVTTSSSVSTPGRFLSRPAMGASRLPFGNTTAATTSAKSRRSIVVNGSCSTAYDAYLTTVCATVLRGIATALTITNCNQEVTFSKDVSFNVATPAQGFCGPSGVTAAPVVTTTTAVYVARWDALTEGAIPSDITRRVCINGRCTDNRDTLSTTKILTTRTTTITTTKTITLYPSRRPSVVQQHVEVGAKLTAPSLSAATHLASSEECTSTLKTAAPNAAGNLVDPAAASPSPVANPPTGTSSSTTTVTVTISSTSTVTSTLPFSSAAAIGLSSSAAAASLSHLTTYVAPTRA